MNNIEQKTRILELIELMGNENTPNVMRETYHDRVLILLENYCGKDFEILMNKYLTAEWRDLWWLVKVKEMEQKWQW